MYPSDIENQQLESIKPNTPITENQSSTPPSRRTSIGSDAEQSMGRYSKYC